MPPFLFQLGHCPDLSFAELASVNQRYGEPLTSLTLHRDVATGNAHGVDEVLPLCDELGGTIRCAEMIHENVGDDPGAIPRQLTENEWFASLLQQESKIVLGAALLGDTGKIGGKRKAGGWLHDVAGAIKGRLLEDERSVRFVTPDAMRDNLILNGGHIHKNKIPERGGEFIAWVEESGSINLGRTVWWQPIEDFSKRDYGRPNRDSRSGMLPPKLARMLINLARTDETQTLLDPFCGSGSMLMEAGLMGLDATGIDYSEKAIHDTHKNLEWLRDNTDVEANLRAVVGDATKLRTLCEPLYFDSCATEPDLGPPLRKPMSVQRYDEEAKRLTALYRRALGEIRTVVKPGARVVFIVPRITIQDRDKPGQLFLLADLKLQGYTLLNPLDNFAPAEGRTTLVYSRPKQFVHREILVLQA